MIPKLVHFHPVHDYILHLRFADGVEGDVDLKGELYGKLFEPLKEQSFFLKVSIQPDFHTLVWPNGADISPEFLYEKTLESQGTISKSHVAETQQSSLSYPSPSTQSPNTP